MTVQGTGRLPAPPSLRATLPGRACRLPSVQAGDGDAPVAAPR